MKFETKKYRIWFRVERDSIKHWCFKGERNEPDMEFMLGTSYDFFIETPMFKFGISRMTTGKPKWNG